MDRKHILFISSWFPNKLEPTNGNFVQRHAEAVSVFHDVEVLHAIGDPHQKKMYIIDNKIINKIKTVIVYYRDSKNPVQNFYRRMNAYKMGFRIMQKPDLVHANILHNNLLFAVYLKKRHGIPFVVTEHWTALRKVNHGKTSGAIKNTAKFIGNHASEILPVSKELEDGLRYLGIKTKMQVVPNVVDTELFSPRGSKSSVKFTFIHVSSLIPRKNPDKILSTALKLLSEGYQFKLKIGGDGDTALLKNMAELSGFSDNIEVFGMQPIESIAKKMKESDCFILYSDDENLPCVLLESMACGIPVIATDVGGISEFFPKNFGILLKEKSEENLRKAMLDMMSENITADAELADFARQNFSKKAIGAQYSSVYKSILKW